MVKVADEVWIATALLHREHPERDSFQVGEIVDRAVHEKLREPLRPGVQIHASVHCVANNDGEPMYFNFDNDQPRKDGVNPPRPGNAPRYTDPNRYADLLY